MQVRIKEAEMVSPYNIIDKDGFIIDVVEYKDTDDIPENAILGVVQGFYNPKYNRELKKWEEGMPQSDIDAIVASSLPVASEIDYLVDLDFRLSLIELGVQI